MSDNDLVERVAWQDIACTLCGVDGNGFYPMDCTPTMEEAYKIRAQAVAALYAPARCDAQSEEAKQFINEILDYFQNEDRDPGGDWAFPDDFSSLCLDYRDRHETKFWINIERDGTIRLVWRLRGGKIKCMTFRALSATKPAQGVGK